MSWVVLINTQGSSFKYWSYDNSSGERRWGRIGGRGDVGYYSLSENVAKSEEKLGRGYMVFSENFPTYSPTSAQVREFLGGTSESSRPQPVSRARRTRTTRATSTPPPTIPTPAPRRTRTVRRDEVRAMQVPFFNRNHAVPSVDRYATDRNGYIKKINNYQRIGFDAFAQRIRFIPLKNIVGRGGEIIRSHQQDYVMAEEYFDNIQQTQQYWSTHSTRSPYNRDNGKPPSLKNLRADNRPSYVCIFYTGRGRETSKCVGIYGIHSGRNTGSEPYCDFLSISSTARNRTSLLKLTLSQIGFAVGDKIKIDLINERMIEEIKGLAPFTVSSSRTSLTYRVVDLRRFGQAQARPARWMP